MTLVLIKTTVEHLSDAQCLCEQLVAQKLAACVSIGSTIHSHYVWQNQTHWVNEYPLLIKTLQSKQSAVCDFLRCHHPYDTPEIVCVACHDVDSDYVQWVETTLGC